jgi:hypothetical protein
MDALQILVPANCCPKLSLFRPESAIEFATPSIKLDAGSAGQGRMGAAR